MISISLNKSYLYLSALSGGADSTALLLLLLENGYNVEAVHCNFHLRGEESDRDENFCKALCRSKGVKLHIAHFDTKEYASLHHQSIETAARNLRYSYFFALAKDIGADGLCVAHNKNDQAETILMNLVRGSGIQGLKGIEPVAHPSEDTVPIYRPLLKVTRAEIVEYLHERNQDWVDDSTNFETDATRNKFRLEIIPMLEKINPAVIGNIANAGASLREVSKIYNKAIAESIDRVVSNEGQVLIDIPKLQKEISSESVLYEILRKYGFNSSQVSDIYSRLNGTSGRMWTSANYELVIDRDKIIIAEKELSEGKIMKIPEPGLYRFDDKSKISIKSKAWDADSRIPRSRNSVCLDSSNISFPLTLRSCLQGDRFVPFGMTGSKLVSDFLTDCKLSLIDKKRQLVLCDGSGKILWVVGLRPDNRYRVGKNTANVLAIDFIPSENK